MASNDFVKSEPIEFSSMETNSSMKTNLTLFARNWKQLQTYLTNLLTYLKYVDGILDIDTFMSTLISAFQSSKASLTIFSTYVVGEINNITSNGITYSIARIDANTMAITNTNTSAWDVEKVMVDVKTVAGVKVYPVITTIDGKITIYFADGIKTDYLILFV